MDKKSTCCFAGLRPKKLPWGYDEEWIGCIKLKAEMAAEIKAMLIKGIRTFISGMAIGADMWGAELVINLKETYPKEKIRLEAAIPFEGQADRWSVDYRERYFNILAQADDETIFYDRYTKSCIEEAAKYMIDKSSCMIAVFDGKPGRTADILKYADSRDLEIITINPDDLSKHVKPRFHGLTLLK